METLTLATFVVKANNRVSPRVNGEDAFYGRHAVRVPRLLPAASAVAAFGLGALTFGLLA